MKEYIIYYENAWRRFTLGRFGLCVSKMENNRFGEAEVLVPDAKADFCAAAGEVIHVVCQSENGNILYLTYNGSEWEKTVLLESKESKPYPKYFSLIPLGNLMNLFYVINHGEKTMLVHQILDGSYSAPEVVDYITPVGIRYFAAPHISSDISLSYKNINGICGTKVYRWSHKSFLQFVPFSRDTGLMPPFMRISEHGTQSALTALKNGEGCIEFYLTNDMGENIKTELAKTADADCVPVIFSCRDKTYVQWLERGCVMSAASDDNGRTFGAPVKYIKNALSEAILFVIDNGEEKCSCYACKKGNSLFFYSVPDILNEMKRSKGTKTKTMVSGQEAAEFASRSGFKKASGWEDDPYVTQKELKSELEKLRLVMEGYNKILDELNKKN